MSLFLHLRPAASGAEGSSYRTNKRLFVRGGGGGEVDCNKSLIYKATLDLALVNAYSLSLRKRTSLHNVEDADALACFHGKRQVITWTIITCPDGFSTRQSMPELAHLYKTRDARRSRDNRAAARLKREIEDEWGGKGAPRQSRDGVRNRNFEFSTFRVESRCEPL